MATVNLTDHMVRGQIYTFTFSYIGSASSDDFADSANQVQGVSQAFVADMEATTVAITFAYAGDGSDNVVTLANNIANQLPVDSADIVSATVPGVAPPPLLSGTTMETSVAGTIYGGASSAGSAIVDAAGATASALKTAADTTTRLLYAVAVVAVIGLFVYVGGPGAIKRNL